MKSSFKLTQKQEEAMSLISKSKGSRALYLLMYGGSQSAKTSFACYFMQMSCIKYPKTTCIICRRNFTDLKATIFQNTFPSMMELRYEGEADPNDIITYNYSPPLSATFYNGSRIYFIGLEDNANFEKILGRKISQFLIDEASEVGYSAFAKLTTRLSETSGARHIGFVTMNPTSVFSWTYKMFIAHNNPIDDKPLKNSDIFKSLQMNPSDNLENLPEGYVENLENLSEHDRERFLFGNFTMTTEGAVYEEQIRQTREDKKIYPLGMFKDNWPIHVAVDIGYDDFNSAWVYQITPDTVNFYFYHERQHTDISTFINEIKDRIGLLQKKWNRNTICLLPHDANNHWVGNGMSVKQILMLSENAHPERPMGLVAPKNKPSVYEGINAARLLFHVCVFDEHGCDIGLRRLGAYKEYFVDGNDEFSKKPKHDMASHCADAFRYAMYNFYFEPKERLVWQKDPNAIYGSDLMNKSTKRKLGII